MGTIELRGVDHCTVHVNGIEPRNIVWMGCEGGAVLLKMKNTEDIVIRESDFWRVLNGRLTEQVPYMPSIRPKDTRTPQQILDNVLRMIEEWEPGE